MARTQLYNNIRSNKISRNATLSSIIVENKVVVRVMPWASFIFCWCQKVHGSGATSYADHHFGCPRVMALSMRRLGGSAGTVLVWKKEESGPNIVCSVRFQCTSDIDSRVYVRGLDVVRQSGPADL